MATTSSNLVAGKAMVGQGNKGKGGKGRVATLVAAAALGLTLVGSLIGHGRQAVPAAQQAQNSGPLAVSPNTASDLGTQFDPYIINGSLPRYVSASTAAVNTTSDLGTEFDPYIINGSLPRSVPALTAQANTTSDLGTQFDPYIVNGSLPRYGAVPATPNTASDLGTEYDPYIINGSLPRFAPAQDWEQQERTQVAP